MNTLPRTPTALREELCVIFPKYGSDYEKYGPLHDFPSTFHSVLIEFTIFFGAEFSSFTEDQLRKFAAIVNASVEQDGALENAFGTCLLEHLHQIGVGDAFIPYLSELARKKTRP